MIEALWEADAVLNVLLLSHPKPHYSPGSIAAAPIARALQAPLDLPRIAEATGGEVWRMENAREPLQRALQKLRIRYSLYFSPPDGKPGETRTIAVELGDDAKLRNPGARVKARTAYVYRPAKPVP